MQSNTHSIYEPTSLYSNTYCTYKTEKNFILKRFWFEKNFFFPFLMCEQTIFIHCFVFFCHSIPPSPISPIFYVCFFFFPLLLLLALGSCSSNIHILFINSATNYFFVDQLDSSCILIIKL